MKRMKQVVCMVMAAVLSLALCVGAFAANAVVSTQKLEIDGKAVSAQPYNVGGNNYFKLRDIASLLSGTDAQFDVGYDQQSNAVSITTGKAYTKVGGELAAVSGTKAANPSSQTIYIDGKKNTELTVYNIDGNNYFKLRDLGQALSFDVDYDQERSTMLIATTAGVDPNWAPDIRFTTVDMSGNQWTDACFARHELTIINFWAYWCGPCVNEMPDLQRLATNYAAKDVQILGISMEQFEQKNIETINELGITYPCLRYTSDFDPYMDTGYLPTTIVVDSSGKVLDDAVIGSMSYREWTKYIGGFLK